MVHVVLPLMVAGVALGQVELSDPSKLALDMNVEIVTLLEINHYASPPDGANLKKWEQALAQAQKAVDANPDNAQNQLAYGRALARLWRYHEAVQAFTEAISLALREPIGYIERGGGFIALRWFEHAQSDLEKATELGANSFKAWYLLGLARYFQQDFENALPALREARRLASSQDDQIRAAFWTYLALRRLGQSDEAKAVLTHARSSTDIGSAQPYLTALRFFKGNFTRDAVEAGMKADGRTEAVLGYALGMHQWLDENREVALDRWRTIVNTNKYWPAHGHIAAEAEIVGIEGVQKSLPLE